MLSLPDKIYCASVPFLPAKDQLAVALKAGRKDRDIFVEGRGAETLAACLAAIRGEGTLGLVGGIRLLGDSRKAVMASLRTLRERGIRPYDFQTGVDDPAELLHEAVTKINSSRMGNHRQSKRKGRRGGLAKGFHAQERRNGIIDDEVLKRLWACPYLTAIEIVEILGPSFSVSTLHRLHGARAKFIKRTPRAKQCRN